MELFRKRLFLNDSVNIPVWQLYVVHECPRRNTHEVKRFIFSIHLIAEETKSAGHKRDIYDLIQY